MESRQSVFKGIISEALCTSLMFSDSGCDLLVETTDPCTRPRYLTVTGFVSSQHGVFPILLLNLSFA